MNNPMHIILPVHNRKALTVRFAEALRRQTWPNFRLLLVDDGSRDETADAVRAILPQTVVLRGRGDWWWAGCLQQGWLWLRHSPPPPDAIIGICNDDMEVGADFLAGAVRELDDNPETLLLAREIDAATGREQAAGVSADLTHLRFVPCREAAAINCLPTRGLFFRWRDFERIGGFHPRLLPHYLSDYEFTLRAHRRGLRLRVAGSFSVRTRHGSTGLERADLLRAPRWRRPAMMFSWRFKENPVAWSGFVLLAVPGWRRFWLLLKVWANAAHLLASCLLSPVSHG
jgi:GT2 family glycosyltransferase